MGWFSDFFSGLGGSVKSTSVKTDKGWVTTKEEEPSTVATLMKRVLEGKVRKAKATTEKIPLEKSFDYSETPKPQAVNPPPQREAPVAPQASSGIEGWMDEQRKAPIREDVKGYLDTTLLPVTRKYGIPDFLAAAQWAVEGGRQQKNNPFGLMFNGQLHPYQSLENAVRDYDLTLRSILADNAGISVDQFNYSDFRPDELTRLLQERANGEVSTHRYEGHSSNPRQYGPLLRSVSEWQYYQ